MHVLIATASPPDALDRVLDSLAEAELPESWRGVLVVENGGQRGVQRRLARCPDRLGVRYRFHAPAGKCGALNAGLADIGTGPVVLLDDDVRLHPRTLTAYAQAHRAQPGHYFGGPCRVDYQQPPAAHLKRFLPHSAKGWEPHGRYGPERPMIFLGFNWSARCDDLLASGGFPEHIGPGRALRIGDEDYLQLALIKRGIAWSYVPDAEVWHWVPESRCSEDWLLDRAYHNGRSRVALQAYAESSRPHRWQIDRRRFTAVLRHMQAAVTRRPDHRFRARLATSINLGMRDGLRDLASNPPVTAPLATPAGTRA